MIKGDRARSIAKEQINSIDEHIVEIVSDSGEGRWTVQQAVETAVSAPVITASLYQRFRSRDPDSFSDKMLAALRNEFGGHAVRKK